MLILPPCLGTCSVVLLGDRIPEKVIHVSKYSHPQKDRNGVYHCIYLYIHRAYSNLVACTSTVSLVGVAVFHVVGTRACQPSKTRVSDYHQNIGISRQCSQYSVVIKAVDIKTVPEDTCIKFPEPSRFECQKMLNA